MTSCQTTCCEHKVYHFSRHSHLFINALFPVAIHQPSDHVCEKKKFRVVIETTCTPRPQLHRHRQIVFNVRLILVFQTFDNPKELGPDYMGELVGGRDFQI
jgi:hypothetical protein